MNREEIKADLISEDELKEVEKKLKGNDIYIEEGLKLLDGDFMQYRKLMKFFTEYQQDQIRQMEQLIFHRDEASEIEFTRIMHTLKSNAKAIGAVNLYEIAKELEYRGKQKDIEYILSAYGLLNFEWNRVLDTANQFLEITRDMVSDDQKDEKRSMDVSKMEARDQIKQLIIRYQAREAKERIKDIMGNEMSEEERNIIKEISTAIDQLDFDEAETLMKRWEEME